ncbi:uncharacterized protein VTP21DRAFT_4176 [Calcarisporiella thermophila]|uniref:uncharacterized protein n=1 Tax=Calcarisporiella thermophila TaxID=911321 RepID=UPI0037436537
MGTQSSSSEHQLQNMLGSSRESELSSDQGRFPTSTPNKRARLMFNDEASSTEASEAVDTSRMDKDFLCPICLQIIKEAFMTRCGHSYCYLCITKHLEHRQDCPTCGASVVREQIYPNFLLNRLLEKATTTAQQQQQRSSAFSKMRQFILRQDRDWSMDEINELLASLLDKKRQLESVEKEEVLQLMHDFLQMSKTQKEKTMESLYRELQCLTEDLKKTQEQLSSLDSSVRDNLRKADDELEAEIEVGGANEVPNEVPITSTASLMTTAEESSATNAGKKRGYSDIEVYRSSEVAAMLDRVEAQGYESTQRNNRIAMKKERIREHFTDLQDCYFRYRLNAPISDKPYELFASTLSRFTSCSRLSVLNTLRYGDTTSLSIVSSIDFDRDDEYFATAGVMKKIKIFEFANLDESLTALAERDPLRSSGFITRNLSRSSSMSNQRFIDEETPLIHGGEISGVAGESLNGRTRMVDTVLQQYPIREMVCRQKISCLSWNSYIKSHLASSDYEGVVTLWDALSGTSLLTFDEHERRTWSVDFSKADPTRLASGSDDSKVKIWSTNQKHSVLTVESKANICCVKFNPSNNYNLAFGSADHNIHYYDLRQPREPLNVFKGHRKAVSYVRFTGPDEFVSASTDSTLKLWDTRGNADLSLQQPQPQSSQPQPQQEQYQPQVQSSPCIRTLTGHLNDKNFVGLSTTSDFIATGSENNSVYIYYKHLTHPVVTLRFGSVNPVTGQDVQDVSDSSLFVSSVCWKKDSNVLLAANSQGTIKVLKLE